MRFLFRFLVNTFEINEIDKKERGKVYYLRINEREVDIMVTWHALDRSGTWRIGTEEVLDALLNPEEVIKGHSNRYIAHKRHGDHIIRAIYEYEDKILT